MAPIGMHQGSTRRSQLVGGVVFSALVLAACSSGPASPGVAQVAGSSAAAATTSQSDALLLAVQCLRQHGLPNMPDPIVVSSGPAAGQRVLDKQALRHYADSVVSQAIDACQAALSRAGLDTRSSQRSPQEIQRLLNLARCIRAHGVPNFPDPNPSTGDVTLPPGMSKNSPQLIAAVRACPSQAQAAGITPPPASASGAGG
jgi:hypothetical protein